MKASLIITTYNWYSALQLTIKSVLSQTLLPWEIIVADDGSTDGTQKILQELSSSVPIKHVWQEDRGFRAAKIRNKAIVEAEGDYIIMVDGDILLDRHFVEDHTYKASEKQFIQGGRVLLSKDLTVKLLKGRISEISIFGRGLGNRKNILRSSLLAMIFSKRKRSLNGIKTCNFSFWRDDALNVNGFNEDFEGWGREDSEFAARLMFAGVKRKDLRFNAVAFHLFHSYQERVNLSHNDMLLAETIREELTYCTNGVNKYIP